MIPEEEALRLAMLIVEGTGSGWTDDGTSLLVDEIRTWKDPGAAYAAADAIARGWTADWRPSLGKIIAAYTEAETLAAARAAVLAATARGSCDGTGWLEGVPCKVCNPILREVFETTELWRRYLDGARLDVLIPDVKERHVPVERCKIDTRYDPTGRPMAPKEGRSRGIEGVYRRIP